MSLLLCRPRHDLSDWQQLNCLCLLLVCLPARSVRISELQRGSKLSAGLQEALAVHLLQLPCKQLPTICALL